MATRNAMAIEIGRRRLRAVLGTFEQGKLHVRRVLVEELPAEIDRDDAAAVGAWIGQTLEAADFPRGRVTVALPREHVGLKRLLLPTSDANELPDMTRIALNRELPFDAERAVIDFVIVDRGDASTTVMAVAVPEAVLNTTRAIIAAAGLSIERIALRATGCAALLKSMAVDGADCLLAVDVSGDNAEFCVVENGDIRFSRAAHLADDAGDGEMDPEVLAERVVTETRRSWMSYRIVQDASDVRRVAVMGDDRVATLAAAPIGEMLKVEAEPVTAHPRITSNGERLDWVWPLAGLLLESGLGDDMIDFERPRQAVDRGGQLRRRGLLIAAVVAIALLGAWTVGNMKLKGLAAEKRSLTSARQRLEPKYARVHRDKYKLEHLRQWEKAHVAWLDHAGFIQKMLPPPDSAVLDSWVGTLEFRGVRFDSKEKKKPWSAPVALTLVIDGEARDRATADALREALVETKWYSASSSGADAEGGKRHPHGFTYRLRSAATSVSEPEETADAGRPAEEEGS